MIYSSGSEYAMTILEDNSMEFSAKHEYIYDFNRATVTVKATQEKYSTFTIPVLNAGYIEIMSTASIKIPFRAILLLRHMPQEEKVPLYVMILKNSLYRINPIP